MRILFASLLVILAIGCFAMGTYNYVTEDYGWAAIMYLCWLINVMNAAMVASRD